MNWNGFDPFSLGNGKTLYYLGKKEEEAHIEGMRFLLYIKAKKCLMYWNPVSSRICTVSINPYVSKITIVQFHAPTEIAPEEEENMFYHSLNTVLDSFKRQNLGILTGDINGKICGENKNREHVIGGFVVNCEIHDNDERFLEICGLHRLVVGGLIFAHKECNKVTWVSPDGHTGNQIDHYHQ